MLSDLPGPSFVPSIDDDAYSPASLEDSDEDEYVLDKISQSIRVRSRSLKGKIGRVRKESSKVNERSRGGKGRSRSGRGRSRSMRGRRGVIARGESSSVRRKSHRNSRRGRRGAADLGPSVRQYAREINLDHGSSDSDSETSTSSSNSNLESQTLKEVRGKWRWKEPNLLLYAYDKNPGPTSTSVTSNSKPLELFERFFPEEAWALAVEETNRYANTVCGTTPKSRPGKDTNIIEMKAFVGMLICFGVLKLPHIEMY